MEQGQMPWCVFLALPMDFVKSSLLMDPTRVVLNQTIGSLYIMHNYYSEILLHAVSRLSCFH